MGKTTLDSLQKTVDEHEAIIQTLIATNKTRLTLDEQRLRTCEYQKQRLDALELTVEALQRIIINIGETPK